MATPLCNRMSLFLLILIGSLPSLLRSPAGSSLDDLFDTVPARAGVSVAKRGVIEYADGWKDADSTRVATENPIAFLWLAQRKFVPVTYRRAKDLVKAIHGDKSFLKLVSEYHARRNPAAPPPPP